MILRYSLSKGGGFPLIQGTFSRSRDGPVEAITFVTEGNAREEVVSSGNNAYRAVVGFVGPGEDIGLLSLVDRAPHSSSVIAMRRLQAVEVPIDVVQRTLEAPPEWNKVIAETAVSRLRANTLWLQALV